MKVFLMNKKYIAGLFFLVCSIEQAAEYKLGLENIPATLPKVLCGKRIGLVTNQTGKDQQGNRNVDLLLTQGFNITHLFAPEHGIDGKVHAGETVHDAKDTKTGLPIVSVYKKGAGKSVDTKLLRDIDLFIFDMQDAGMRHYTYVSTLYKLLELGAEHGKPVLVLDRPNPLGAVMEGPLVEPKLSSFISIAPIALRHGMTLGELSNYFNAHHFNNKVDLKVVPMVGYKRTDGLQKMIVPLSPNLPSLASVHGYSFLGLLGEVGPFDVGVGTKNAFQCITLPVDLKFDTKKLDKLRTILKDHGIKSSWCYRKNSHKNKSFVGLYISIDNPNLVSTVRTLLAVLEFFKHEGVQLQFRTFDRAMGTDKVRHYLEGRGTKKRLVRSLKHDTQAFYLKAKPFFLYEPFPQITESFD